MKHRRCPYVVEINALRATCDHQHDVIATLERKLTQAHADRAWETKAGEAQAEVRRLADMCQEYEDHAAIFAEMIERTNTANAALAKARDAAVTRAVLADKVAEKLRDDLANAADPDAAVARLTRKLADAEKRADAAEAQGVRDRDAILDRDAQLCALRPHVRQVDAPAYVLDTSEGVTHPPLGGRP